MHGFFWNWKRKASFSACGNRDHGEIHTAEGDKLSAFLRLV